MQAAYAAQGENLDFASEVVDMLEQADLEDIESGDESGTEGEDSLDGDPGLPAQLNVQLSI